MIDRKFIAFIMVGSMVLMAAFGSQTMRSGIGMGIAAATSLMLVYIAMPVWIQKLIIRFRFLVDIAFSIGIYMMFGRNTVTAIIGAIVAELIVTLLLKNEHTLHRRQSGASLISKLRIR